MDGYKELVKTLRDKNNCDVLDYVDGAADAIEDLTAALAASNEVIAKSKPRWIPVEERLPEAHKNVLCCGSKGGMFVGWVASKTYDGGDKATAFVGGGQGRKITHWMPLPEPPEVRKDG